jgi:hypothetical protein
LADLGYEFVSHGHIKHDIYAMFLRQMATTFFLSPWFNRSASSKANHALQRHEKQFDSKKNK